MRERKRMLFLATVLAILFMLTGSSSVISGSGGEQKSGGMVQKLGDNDCVECGEGVTGTWTSFYCKGAPRDC